MGRTPEQLRGLITWAEVFSRELDIVRAARNAVAHAEPLDDIALVQSVALSRELLDSLRRMVGLDIPDPPASSGGPET